MFYPKQFFSGIHRLWFLIASTQTFVIFMLYIFAGQNAFFLLGPFLLYDLAIYTYPYWYPPLITTELYKGSELQMSLEILKQSFNKQKRVRPELLMMNTEFDKMLIFAHRTRIWVLVGKDFMNSFNPAEQKIIFSEVAQLQKNGRLAAASIISALFYTLPFLPVRKGIELNFFSENEQESWNYLNYKTFHRLSLKGTVTQSYLLPCLFFPALSNYSADSYFSLYTFLRERLIKSMGPASSAAAENFSEKNACDKIDSETFNQSISPSLNHTSAQGEL